MRRIALWAAVGLFVSGIWIATLDIYAPDGSGCGTVFASGEQIINGEEVDNAELAACEQPRSEARQLPIALLVLGGSLVLSTLPWGAAFRQGPSARST
jgi:hypothetical protein